MILKIDQTQSVRRDGEPHVGKCVAHAMPVWDINVTLKLFNGAYTTLEVELPWFELHMMVKE